MVDVNDAAKQAEAKAAEVSAAANAQVQAQGPGVVAFIKTYYPYALGLLALLAVLHFGFGVNL